MSKAKAVGTFAETGLTRWLQDNGFRYARRLAQAGARDVGDVSLGDGIAVAVEVKNTAAPNWAGELDETLAEQARAIAHYGVLVRKRRGKGNPGEWYAMTTVEQMFRLLLQAGYGRPDDDQ